jgi:hypothetical protein
MRGRVVKPTAEKRAAEVLDGIVAYPDANGVECFAAFGAHQVRPRVHTHLADTPDARASTLPTNLSPHMPVLHAP